MANRFWNYARAKKAFDSWPAIQEGLRLGMSGAFVTGESADMKDVRATTLAQSTLEIQQSKTSTKHWFLEPDLIAAMWNADGADMLATTLYLDVGECLRMFVSPNPKADDLGIGWIETAIARGYVDGLPGVTDAFMGYVQAYKHDGKPIKPMPFTMPMPLANNGGWDAAIAAAVQIGGYTDYARETFTTMLRFVKIAHLYATSEDRASETLRDPTRERWRRKLARLGGAARRKAERTPDGSRQTFDVFVLRDMPPPLLPSHNEEPPETTVPAAANDDPCRTVGRHEVRGHWRWQACGPKYSQHKLVWIPEHWRGDANKVIGYRMSA